MKYQKRVKYKMIKAFRRMNKVNKVKFIIGLIFIVILIILFSIQMKMTAIAIVKSIGTALIYDWIKDFFKEVKDIEKDIPED